MPFLVVAGIAGIIGLIGGGGAVYSWMDNDEPVTAEERKSARTKYAAAAIAVVGVFAFFKFRKKK